MMRTLITGLMLFFTLICSGCDGRKEGGGLSQDMPTVSSFASNETGGIFSHDLKYKYTGTIELTDVDFSVTFYYENGEKPVVKRYGASWKPGEEKIVNATTAGGKIQRMEFSGTAVRDGIKVKIDAAFGPRE